MGNNLDRATCRKYGITRCLNFGKPLARKCFGLPDKINNFFQKIEQRLVWLPYCAFESLIMIRRSLE